MAYVYLNSRLIPDAAATVSVFDRGFAYGDSLIETLKIMNGRPVFFNEHFARLRRSLLEAGFETFPDAGGLRNQALSLAELNGVSQGRLRIQLSRGTPAEPSRFDPAEGLTPTLLMTADPFAGYPEELYREGIGCMAVAANRGLYARHKSASLFPSIMARLEAAAEGAEEAVFTSGHGRLLEGSLSNIFFFCSGRLLTAGDEQPVLAGITRGKLIGIAEELGIEIRYEAPKPGELSAGEDAAYLTSSILGICPVKSINTRKLRLDHELQGRLADGLRELELADIENF